MKVKLLSKSVRAKPKKDSVSLSESELKDIFDWLDSMRGKRTVKFLSGIRGVGKSTVLTKWREKLLKEGYPEERFIVIDAEQPILRHLVTSDAVLAYLSTQFPEDGGAMIFIDEPSSFPNYEEVIGTLLGDHRLDIYLTMSTHRVLTGGLSDYLRGAVSVYEILPSADPAASLQAENFHARWIEILLRDVLSEPGIQDAALAERIAAYLSDSVGEPVSLRSITSAVSPPGKLISPNTADAYLTALENAHVVEKCYRWNTDLEQPIRSGYRVFFTDTTLRAEQFGLAPMDDDFRTNLNRKWLRARRKAKGPVYLPEDAQFLADCDFVEPPKPEEPAEE